MTTTKLDEIVERMDRALDLTAKGFTRDARVEIIFALTLARELRRDAVEVLTWEAERFCSCGKARAYDVGTQCGHLTDGSSAVLILDRSEP